MDDHLKGGLAADQQRPVDPLRRVFVPIEKRNADGVWVLRTQDKQQYTRGEDGVIRRVAPKVNGKIARKQRIRARREDLHHVQQG